MFLACLALCVAALPGSLAADRDGGMPGTFVADNERCDRYAGCEWTGTFESADGRMVESNSMTSDDLKERGDTVAAQKVGQEIYKPDSKAWVFFLIGAAGSFAYVVWFGWARWARRRRG